MKHRIAIRNGMAEYIDDDALIPLAGRLGKLTRKRASYVEPDNQSGGWTANMQPSLPPGLTPPMSEWLLGPFPTRAEALAAEREWLQKNCGL